MKVLLVFILVFIFSNSAFSSRGIVVDAFCNEAVKLYPQVPEVRECVNGELIMIWLEHGNDFKIKINLANNKSCVGSFVSQVAVVDACYDHPSF